MILGSGLLTSSWPKSSDWLIRDEFSDTVAAGSVNGTAATPGPGTRTVTDTENKLSVGSGALAIAGGKASPAGGDPGVWYDAQTRAAGLAQITKLAITSGTLYATFDTNLTSIGEFGFNAINGLLYTSINTSGSAVLDSVMSGTSYTHATVARESGYFSIIKGDGISNWRLMWVGNTHTTASIYPGIQNLTSVCIADYLRVLQLPAPFDSDDGLATDTHSGSVAAGTAFVHEADCLVEYTLTTRPSADNADVLFRVQDASNYWICRVNSSGDISLVEVVAGTPTTRGTAAGVVSSGHRVVVIADSTTIKVYSNNTLRITYASATNFATATAGEVDALGTGGVVSDLKTWPRTLSGTAAGILNKASA